MMESNVGGGSAIKLVNNMADVDYVRRAKACDALGSAWDALDQANKPIPDKVCYTD